jgi:Flp pilus assembly protein TadG
MRTPPEPARVRERGSAAVEFALVLPLVLVVMLGLVQVGLIARDRLLVEAAARAGARAAALADDDAATRAAALAAAPGIDGSRTTVHVTRSGSRGDPVEVTIEYAAALRVPYIAWLVGAEVTMRSSAVARQEFA